jgi:predicted transcriptional regulator
MSKKDKKTELTNKFLKELKDWCDAKRGRQVELAKAIKTTRWTISHWMGRRQRPTAEQVLRAMEFLEQDRGRK